MDALIIVVYKITYMAYEFGEVDWGLRNEEGLVVLPLVRKSVQSLTLENLRCLDGPRQILC